MTQVLKSTWRYIFTGIIAALCIMIYDIGKRIALKDSSESLAINSIKSLVNKKNEPSRSFGIDTQNPVTFYDRLQRITKSEEFQILLQNKNNETDIDQLGVFSLLKVLSARTGTFGNLHLDTLISYVGNPNSNRFRNPSLH